MANDLIFREAVLEELKQRHDLIMQDPEISKLTKLREAIVYHLTIEAVKKTPTVDAVPVIRCRDCKFWSRDGNGYCDDESRCNNPDGLDNFAKPDDFCSYGERKDHGK